MHQSLKEWADMLADEDLYTGTDTDLPEGSKTMYITQTLAKMFEADLREIAQWFTDNAGMLASKQIGGYRYDPPLWEPKGAFTTTTTVHDVGYTTPETLCTCDRSGDGISNITWTCATCLGLVDLRPTV